MTEQVEKWEVAGRQHQEAVAKAVSEAKKAQETDPFWCLAAATLVLEIV